MKCPKCDHKKTNIVALSARDFRYRKCANPSCGYRFKTVEIPLGDHVSQAEYDKMRKQKAEERADRKRQLQRERYRAKAQREVEKDTEASTKHLEAEEESRRNSDGRDLAAVWR